MADNRNDTRVNGYGRFWGAFNRARIQGDREETRRQLVLQYTDGRTDSLREMTREEYGALCKALEEMEGRREELRKARSTALRLMQRLGIDTTDWRRINIFCRQPRIAGKPFGRLNVAELEELAVRLRAIGRKGWQDDGGTQPSQTTAYIVGVGRLEGN